MQLLVVSHGRSNLPLNRVPYCCLVIVGLKPPRLSTLVGNLVSAVCPRRHDCQHPMDGHTQTRFQTAQQMVLALSLLSVEGGYPWSLLMHCIEDHDEIACPETWSSSTWADVGLYRSGCGPC